VQVQHRCRPAARRTARQHRYLGGRLARFGNVVVAGEGLHGEDVNGSAEFGAAAAKLPGLHADRAGDDRLARAGRRDKHAEVVPGQFGDSRSLRCSQRRVAPELLRRAGRLFISYLYRLPACSASEAMVPSMPRGRTRLPPPAIVLYLAGVRLWIRRRP
jgi:hypothetical protein